MNTFCDWLSETIVISVYDSFFRDYISIVLLSRAANHSACSYRYVATPVMPVRRGINLRACLYDPT